MFSKNNNISTTNPTAPNSDLRRSCTCINCVSRRKLLVRPPLSQQEAMMRLSRDPLSGTGPSSRITTRVGGQTGEEKASSPRFLLVGKNIFHGIRCQDTPRLKCTATSAELGFLFSSYIRLFSFLASSHSLLP